MNMVKLREKLGVEEFDAARALYRRAGVREVQRTADYLVYSVAGVNQFVKLYANGRGECSCDRAPLCRHLGAALIAAGESGALRAMQELQARDRASALMQAMEGALPESVILRLEPEIRMRGSDMLLGLRIGQDRLYVVRSIPDFLQARRAGQNISFGKGFTYFPGWMRFDAAGSRLIGLLEQHCASLAFADAHVGVQEARLLPLPAAIAAQVWETVRDMTYTLQTETETYTLTGVSEDPLPLSFTLSDRARAGSGLHRLCVTAAFDADIRPLTADWAYVLVDGVVTRVSPAQRGAARICTAGRTDGRTQFLFDPEQTQKVMSELTLWLARVGDLRFSPELERQLTRAPFHAKVYLDRDGRDVTAHTDFIYGSRVIDPFLPVEYDDQQLLLRDAQKEQEITDLLARAGFRVSKGHVYLSGTEEIYRFVTEGAGELTQYAEVFFSKEFRKFTPRKPQLSGMLRGVGGRLQLAVMDHEDEVEELLPLMRALRDRAAYFRFKDGSFVSLEDEDGWQPLAEAVCEAAEYADPCDLGMFRAAYFDALITAGGLPVQLDREARQAARIEAPTPDSPIDCLRPYQLRGFHWLCALRSLRMGGILADDMGLGKTVQTIAALLHFARAEEERMPSLIVAPTSLTYNWLSELKRFAPELSVMLLSGSQQARADQISSLADGIVPDILVTSYPLIRRDIGLLSGIPFRFAVLDEAQQIKNAASVGAHAVKQLNAQTRIALTGTPMENHAGELWSIFDFILPGYLPRAGAFMRRYGEGENNEELMCRIRPFLMRRLKKDVLTELPDKLELTMMAEMTPEQRRVYQASLLRRRDHVQELLSTRGLAKGRAEVLSAITELRQICCHPVLCLSDYAGASGKLEMLVDILVPAVQNGRRALVFSQFTRMLRLIEGRLRQEGLQSLYLDGDTPADERVRLCDSFNSGEGNIFLLSLKAGGTGLNLTGADMVIHYDPWWNPAAEEQAVDRAHRIGQTRKVEVIRLLVHNSIEEQVVGMSQAKRTLFDKLITPGESMPSKLTEQDLLKLFDLSE